MRLAFARARPCGECGQQKMLVLCSRCLWSECKPRRLQAVSRKTSPKRCILPVEPTADQGSCKCFFDTMQELVVIYKWRSCRFVVNCVYSPPHDACHCFYVYSVHIVNEVWDLHSITASVVFFGTLKGAAPTATYAVFVSK
jgi:hypothetical protein